MARSRNSPQKHVWRAKIILLSADGVGTKEIMRQTGTSKTCVWRWQERFMAEGFEGLLRDNTRPSRVVPLGVDITERVVALTQRDPPAHAVVLLFDEKSQIQALDGTNGPADNEGSFGHHDS